MPHISNSLHLALPLCHSVNNISIHVTKGLKDSDLSCLIWYQMVSMWVSNDTAITFDGGVAPLLKVFGRSLETLALECIDLIRISTIIDLCPNLDVLYTSVTLRARLRTKDTSSKLKRSHLFLRNLRNYFVFSMYQLIFCSFCCPPLHLNTLEFLVGMCLLTRSY